MPTPLLTSHPYPSPPQLQTNQEKQNQNSQSYILSLLVNPLPIANFSNLNLTNDIIALIYSSYLNVKLSSLSIISSTIAEDAWNTLNELCLRHKNTLTELSFVDIVNIPLSFLSSLTKLSLTSLSLSQSNLSSFSSQSLQPLLDLLTKSTTLNSIDLASTHLSSSLLANLLSSIPSDSPLTIISLSNLSIPSSVAPVLSSFILHHKHLSCLDLTFNSFDEATIMSLLGASINSTSILSIDLRWNIYAISNNTSPSSNQFIGDHSASLVSFTNSMSFDEILPLLSSNTRLLNIQIFGPLEQITAKIQRSINKITSRNRETLQRIEAESQLKESLTPLSPLASKLANVVLQQEKEIARLTRLVERFSKKEKRNTAPAPPRGEEPAQTRDRATSLPMGKMPNSENGFLRVDIKPIDGFASSSPIVVLLDEEDEVEEVKIEKSAGSTGGAYTTDSNKKVLLSKARRETSPILPLTERLPLPLELSQDVSLKGQSMSMSTEFVLASIHMNEPNVAVGSEKAKVAPADSKPSTSTTTSTSTLSTSQSTRRTSLQGSGSALFVSAPAKIGRVVSARLAMFEQKSGSETEKENAGKWKRKEEEKEKSIIPVIGD